MRPIRNEGLTEHLVRRMKDCILEGVINPGEQLPARARTGGDAERLKILAAAGSQGLPGDGVLEVKQGSGNYLTPSVGRIVREPVDLLVPLRGITFAELFEARRAMEAESAACAAVRASKHELDEMDAEIERMRLASDDIHRFTAHDTKFHGAIASLRQQRFVWLVALVQQVLLGAQVAHAKASKLPRIRDEHRRRSHPVAKRRLGAGPDVRSPYAQSALHGSAGAIRVARIYCRWQRKRGPFWRVKRGQVERPFAYLESNLLNGRTFTSLEHLNETAAQWLAHTADMGFHQEIKARPMDRFQEEKAHLLALPAHPYDTAQILHRTVNSEGHVLYRQTLLRALAAGRRTAAGPHYREGIDRLRTGYPGDRQASPCTLPESRARSMHCRSAPQDTIIIRNTNC
jgi:DNA-binding FadR family transcriptional regulator